MQRSEMERIPPALQPTRLQLRRVAHGEQERLHGLPGRRGQSSLDATHRSLRRTGPKRERALAEAVPTAKVLDQRAGRTDT